jgi:prepilin-type processing-associated H-X9-DG protein
LLVVIAIIAILAAILFPVFAKAREKARQTSCLSNVKEIMLAILMYAQDYDETLPSQEPCHRTIDNLDWAYGPGWIQDKVQPYVKNDQIFTCPSDSTLAYGYPSGGFGGYIFAGRPFGGCHGMDDPGGHNRELAAFQAPATSAMMTDGPGSGMWRYWPVLWSPDWNPGWCCQLPVCRHNEGANCGYLDGHAKWQKKIW